MSALDRGKPGRAILDVAQPFTETPSAILRVGEIGKQRGQACPTFRGHLIRQAIAEIRKRFAEPRGRPIPEGEVGRAIEVAEAPATLSQSGFRTGTPGSQNGSIEAAGNLSKTCRRILIQYCDRKKR